MTQHSPAATSRAPRWGGASMRLVALLAFGACALDDGAHRGLDAHSADTGVEEAAAKPMGRERDWQGIVQSRFVAEAQAITPRDGAFVAELPSLGLIARFDEESVRIGGEEGEALSLRTSAWGRVGSLLPVEGRGAPELGDCTTAVDASGACIRRLEYVDAELTEWWVGLGTGLEQGWTVEAAPDGDGLLVVDVVIEGALAVEPAGDRLRIIDRQGRAWTVGSVAAWDSEGEPLPVRAVPTDDGLRIEVDDEGAAYPVEIDPVYDVAVTTLTGTAGWTYFGHSVSGVGDVNQDGYDDVVVGTPGTSTRTGHAYVYHGSSGGLLSTATSTLTDGVTQGCFGKSVSGAGDVNNDGYDDVIIGAPDCYSAVGYAYVYHGSSSGLSTVATTTMHQEYGDDFGKSVSGAGDVNQDGYDDVIVGAESSGDYAGTAFVYHGSATGVVKPATITLAGEGNSENFGSSVSGAGDINKDGYADVLVGADIYGAYQGRTYVYHGSATGLSSTASDTLEGDGPNNHFGCSVSAAGDVNKDGYDDIIVGAYWNNAWTGAAYVYHGSSAGLSRPAATSLFGSAPDDYFGFFVSGVGDVSNDGYDDVIVGAPGYSSSTGRVYLFQGSSAGVSSTATTTLTGAAATDFFGYSVSGVGDVNQDSFDDIVVGAPGISSFSGGVYVYHGDADWDKDNVVGTVDCDDADASVGVASTLYLDEDGDDYGTTEATICPGAGWAAFPGDCDDGAAAVSPEGTELCNGIDDNCDTVIDEPEAIDAPDWYADLDGDLFTDPTDLIVACEAPEGYVTASGKADCDDENGSVYPGAPELPDDAVDEDCDGLELCYIDGDGDGFRPDEITTIESADLGCDEVGEGGNEDPIGDCDDAEPGVHPGAADMLGDGIDQDCDGTDLIGDSGEPEAEGDAPNEEGEPKGGCGCSSSPRPGCAVGLWLLGLLARRPRRMAS